MRLTGLTGRVDYPTIAASGAYVYVAYTDSSTGSVRLAISPDRGKTWKKVTLGSTSSSGPSGKAGYPAVAAAGTNVGIAWISDSSGTQQVRLSTDRGLTFDPPISLGVTTSFPAASAIGSRVGFTWSDTAIHLRVASAGVWEDVRTLPPTDGYATEVQQIPAIALTGNDGVAVAYSACLADLRLHRRRPRRTSGPHLAPVARRRRYVVAERHPVSRAATLTRRINDTPSIVWPSLPPPPPPPPLVMACPACLPACLPACQRPPHYCLHLCVWQE